MSELEMIYQQYGIAPQASFAQAQAIVEAYIMELEADLAEHGDDMGMDIVQAEDELSEAMQALEVIRGAIAA